MATILCVTSGLTGIVHASFELASRLEAAGHRVICGSIADVGEKYAAQGMDYLQLPSVNFYPDPGDHGAGFAARWTQVRTRRRRALDSLQTGQIEAALRDADPDLLLIDLELHDYILAAAGLGIPTVLLNQFFSIWDRPNLPPITSTTLPGRGWRGSRLGIRLDWFALHAKQRLTVLKSAIRSGLTDRRSILRLYAAQTGFPHGELTAAYPFPPPLTYHSLPVLNLTAWELEFPHEPRSHSHYVGPMVCEQREETPMEPDVAARLAPILQARDRSETRLLYGTVTTMGKAARGVVEKLIAAVGSRPDWTLVLGLGRSLGASSFSALPANVHLFDWVPQLTLLRHADCSINHGGIHTINECLHYGVPMLIYPGGRHDQPGNGARIAYHRLGLVLEPGRDDVAAIRQGIDTLLADDGYRQRIHAVNQSVRSQRDQLAAIVNHYLP